MNYRIICITAILHTVPFSVLADCIAAQQVCDDANKAYTQCVMQNPISGAAVCSPLFSAKISACAQADFACRQGFNSSNLFSSDSDKKAHEDAMFKANELMKKIDAVISK
jgi:hypothetical protein